jgi:hypothetical protein
MGANRSQAIASVVVNAVLLVLLNVVPGWAAVPFLTADMAQVVPALNLSLAVSLLGGVVVVLAPRDAVRGFASAIGSAAALVATARLWDVFPFDLTDPWPVVVRIGLGLGLVGCAIGVVAGLVQGVHGLVRGDAAAGPSTAAVVPARRPARGWSRRH